MVTMGDIAARVGLSRSTVSLVLNGRSERVKIAEATRQRILAAAKEMGYQPNQIARAVATGHTKVIGFIGSSLAVEYVGALVSGVLDTAQEKGYLVKILHRSRRMSVGTAIATVIQQRLAGVICMDFDEAALQKAHEELYRHAIPLVILGHTVLNLGARRAPGVRIVGDEEAGMEAAVRHLVSLGHSRIALVSWAGASTAWLTRAQGYRKAMRRRRLPTRVVILRSGTTTVEECRHLLEPPNRPTAIICVTDYHAMGLLRLARSTGLRVPDDLSVIGHSDLAMARYADPPLTTVAPAQPLERVGELVAQRLFAAIEGKARLPARPRKPVLVPTRLIVRESTGPMSPRARTRPSSG
jgi:DNA-binding LacI/PurR family transcriptional regulator